MDRSVLSAIGSVLLCAFTACCGRPDVPELDYVNLNAQAAEEYLRPVHPGIKGQVPFWNGYSFKFIYAPSFDFDDVEGAAGYLYTISSGERSYSFFIDSFISSHFSLIKSTVLPQCFLI